MRSLYLCEKPSQARDVARVVAATRKGEGYLSGRDVTVTWCFGHLLESATRRPRQIGVIPAWNIW